MELSTAVAALLDGWDDVRPQVLVLGDPAGPVADVLMEMGVGCEVADGDWPSIQLSRRFDVVLLEPTATAAAHELAAQMHCGVQHLLRGGQLGTLLASGDGAQIPASRFSLTEVASIPVGRGRLSIHRRADRHTVHDMVFAARSRIGRVTAVDLAALLESDRRAANLADLGFIDVSDLIGGHRAWLAAGLPIERSDHSHLDL